MCNIAFLNRKKFVFKNQLINFFTRLKYVQKILIVHTWDFPACKLSNVAEMNSRSHKNAIKMKRKKRMRHGDDKFALTNILEFSIRAIQSMLKILSSRKVTAKHGDEKSRSINALVSQAYHAANSCKSCVEPSVSCQVERKGTPYIILANIFLPVIPEHPKVPDTPTGLGHRLITIVYDR